MPGSAHVGTSERIGSSVAKVQKLAVRGKHGFQVARRSGGISVFVGRFPRTRLLDNLREGRLADRLLLRITYGMAIYRQLFPD